MGLIIFNTMNIRSDIVGDRREAWLDAIEDGVCLRRSPVDADDPARGEWRLVAYSRPEDRLPSHAIGVWGSDLYIEDFNTSLVVAEAFYQSLVDGTCERSWVKTFHVRMKHRTQAVDDPANWDYRD